MAAAPRTEDKSTQRHARDLPFPLIMMH
ncbi:uncharacterized protein G2W53_042770 [Senna tora]|uniref:Uncharacterized protein n=1 Tax=Senna tora TaxID=362788 RepID=A0A834W473_9FABA|nr:uncharacterized protein G2W53_042770 [Senna tora]